MPIHTVVESAASGKLLPHAKTRLKKLQKVFGRFFAETSIVNGVRIRIHGAGNQQTIHLSGGLGLISLIPMAKGQTNIQSNTIKGKSKWRRLRSFPILIAGVDPVTVTFGYATVRLNDSRFLGIRGLTGGGYEVFSDKLKPWFTVLESEDFVDRTEPIDHRVPVWDGTIANKLFFIGQVSPISYVSIAADFNAFTTPTVVGAVPLVLTADAALEENILSAPIRLLDTENDIMTGGGGAAVGGLSTYVLSVTGRKYTIISTTRTFDNVVRLNINTTTDFTTTSVATLSFQNAPGGSLPTDIGFVSIAAVGSGLALVAIPLHDSVSGGDYIDILETNSTGPTAWVGRIVLSDLIPASGPILLFAIGAITAIGVGAAFMILRAGPDKVFSLRSFDFGVTWSWTEIADFTANIFDVVGAKPALIKPWGSTPPQEAELATFFSEVAGELNEYRSLDSGATWSKLRKVADKADVFGLAHWTNPLNIVGGTKNG